MAQVEFSVLNLGPENQSLVEEFLQVYQELVGNYSALRLLRLLHLARQVVL